ncbi:MAG: AmmeMemoRadiSam system protein B [Phycisphaerales bacterium]|nr:MAG: AmmeMemoRadiSam system protein B [Phycisphaerales bacterium]
MNAGLVMLPAVVAVAVVSAATGCAAGSDIGATVRPADCAGTWYPGDAETLAKEVDELLAAAALPTLTGKPVAVIAPHAGYRWAAPVAAVGYGCLKGHSYKRVIALAFNHRLSGSYRGVDVPAELTAYQTPLGQVPVDRPVCDALAKDSLFASHPGVDRNEWSLELQLPFLQRMLGEFRLVPLLVGRMSDRDWVAAAEAILPWVDDETLLAVSSDFTHYGPNYRFVPFTDDIPDRLRELADAAAAPILKCDNDGFAEHLAKTQDTICGRGPIRLLLRVLSMQGGAQGVRAAFDTSGRMSGDFTNSVTYQSIVLTRPKGTLEGPQRESLLRLARETITAHLNGKGLPAVDAEKLPAALRAPGACFVTLTNRGELRGCIGNMAATGPLYGAVIDNAVSACRDRRFVRNPVTAKELDELHVEISYLTPMQRVSKPGEIIVGRHGLLIVSGGRRGVLLPQVAYSRGWSRDEFLAQTCRKAGLPLDAWSQPAAEIYSFTAEVFGEPE